MAQKTKTRQRNLEELRCLAMMMVIVLHFLGKGELLGDVTADSMGAVGTAAWILEAFCIVAVNCYMLISGYFLCESSFRLSRLLKLYLQVWMYSVGIGLTAAATGIMPAGSVDTHYYLSLFFPVSMGHYWFMTAYVFLYLLLPFVSTAVKRMNRAQLKLALAVLLVVFCVLKSILPFRLEEDGQGYDFLWYLIVFLTAAYLRKSGADFRSRQGRGMLMYVGGCALILAELSGLRYVYLKTGSLGLLLKVSFEYNHIFVLLAALGLFMFFLGAKGDGVLGAAAGAIAPYVLGVYLIHENIGLRYAWQSFFRAGEIGTVPELLLWVIAAVLCMFVIGIVVERIRSLAVGAVGKLFGALPLWKKWIGLLERADASFQEN